MDNGSTVHPPQRDASGEAHVEVGHELKAQHYHAGHDGLRWDRSERQAEHCRCWPCLILLSISSPLEGGTILATQQLLVRLPEDLIRRLKRRVPARGRSTFIQRLLEQALPRDEGEDDPLYRAALEVERDERLAAEMAEWDDTARDGLASEASAADDK